MHAVHTSIVVIYRGGMIWAGRESARKWFYKNEKKKKTSRIIYDGRHVAGARCCVCAFNRRRIYLCNRYTYLCYVVYVWTSFRHWLCAPRASLRHSSSFFFLLHFPFFSRPNGRARKLKNRTVNDNGTRLPFFTYRL